jgi:hypothetical protein
MTFPDSNEICEALIRYVEMQGTDIFEKNLVRNGEVQATVWCLLGENAEEFNIMARTWLKKKGYKLDSHTVQTRDSPNTQE